MPDAEEAFPHAQGLSQQGLRLGRPRLLAAQHSHVEKAARRGEVVFAEGRSALVERLLEERLRPRVEPALHVDAADRVEERSPHLGTLLPRRTEPLGGPVQDLPPGHRAVFLVRVGETEEVLEDKGDALGGRRLLPRLVALLGELSRRAAPD